MPLPQGRKEPDSSVQIQTTLGAPTCPISAISWHPGRHYHHRVCSLQMNRLSWPRLGKDPLCLRRITQLCICSHSTYASHSCAQLHRLWSSGPRKTKHHLTFPFSPKRLDPFANDKGESLSGQTHNRQSKRTVVCQVLQNNVCNVPSPV